MLSEKVTDFNKKIVFISEKHEQKLKSTDFCVLVDCVYLLVFDFFHHLVIDFLELIKNLVESRPFLMIIGEHIVCEKLPIRM